MAASTSATSTTITAVDPPKDRLSALPPELLHTICDYLLPTHNPEKPLYSTTRKSKRTTPHPIDCLAAASRPLRASVNSWAHHWLKAHAKITHHKEHIRSIERRGGERNYLHRNGGLFTWLDKHCIFCGKSSARTAILVNGFKCCKACDGQEWKDKITKSAAMDEYDLKPHHLLPHLYSPSHTVNKKHPQSLKLPKVRYGKYITYNVEATMFLQSEVRALADAVHGDFEAHLRRKQANREARLRKKEGFRREILVDDVKTVSPAMLAGNGSGSTGSKNKPICLD
jgi:hypothetical protein